MEEEQEESLLSGYVIVQINFCDVMSMLDFCIICLIRRVRCYVLPHRENVGYLLLGAD